MAENDFLFIKDQMRMFSPKLTQSKLICSTTMSIFGFAHSYISFRYPYWLIFKEYFLRYLKFFVLLPVSQMPIIDLGDSRAESESDFEEIHPGLSFFLTYYVSSISINALSKHSLKDCYLLISFVLSYFFSSKILSFLLKLSI